MDELHQIHPPQNFKGGDIVLYDGHAVFAISGYPKVVIAAHNKNQCSGNPNYRREAVY